MKSLMTLSDGIEFEWGKLLLVVSDWVLLRPNKVDIVGARCLTDFNNVGDENARIFERIGCERLKIDGNFIVCGEDFIVWTVSSGFIELVAPIC